MPFDLVGCGGTFDHLSLHEGHKFLLKTAFSVGNKVVIGLAIDDLLKDKLYKDRIEPYNVREQNIYAYIKSLNKDYVKRCKIIPLNDRFGPTITEPNLEAHVSSEETMSVAMKINEIREKNGLKKMVLIIIPIFRDKKGQKISSTEIRKNL